MGRKTRKIAFDLIKYCAARPLAGLLLETEISGLENLSGTSAGVLACHHGIGIDGIILNAIFPKKIHFLVQYENIFDKRWPKLAEFFEQVPIRVNDGREASLKDAIEKCEEYYRLGSGFFGVMTDGPSKDLMKDEKILRLEERPNYGAAVLIANSLSQGKERVPVFPVAIRVSEKNEKDLWQWASGKVGENLAYIWRNSPIKYSIAIGNPLYTENYKGNLAGMNREIREEQIRMLRKKKL